MVHICARCGTKKSFHSPETAESGRRCPTYGGTWEGGLWAKQWATTTFRSRAGRHLNPEDAPGTKLPETS